MESPEIAALAFRKDALIAQFTGTRARWLVAEGAAHAALGLVLLGSVTGDLPGRAAMLLAAGAGGVLLLSSHQLNRLGKRFAGELADLLEALERLKSSEGPS